MHPRPGFGKRRQAARPLPGEPPRTMEADAGFCLCAPTGAFIYRRNRLVEALRKESGTIFICFHFAIFSLLDISF